jgi:hypothetical protein
MLVGSQQVFKKLILVRGGYFRRKNQGFDNKQIHIRRAQEVSKSYHLIPCMGLKNCSVNKSLPPCYGKKGKNLTNFR